MAPASPPCLAPDRIATPVDAQTVMQARGMTVSAPAKGRLGRPPAPDARLSGFRFPGPGPSALGRTKFDAG